MHHGETPTLSQEQAAAVLWLLQHLREWGVRGRRWLPGSRATPQPCLTPPGDSYFWLGG